MGLRVLVLIFSLSLLVAGYKPTVLLHGILTGSECMTLIKDRIQEKHPGTVVYNIDRFGGWSSLDSMWYQIQQLKMDILNISQSHPEGFNFLGYSQGGLLGRALIQDLPDHNVHNFISLSSPQAGQYGTEFLHIIFPNLALKTAYELFYSRVGQHTSVGNYWNDPHHQSLYYSYSDFLPYINNEIGSNKSEQFKAAILKLNKLVLIGGPDDNVITPWQSSQFGYFNLNETVVKLVDRDIYIEDTIGLRTLDKKGKLILITVPGIDHYMWHINETIVDQYILPYLD
ncbi:hypothetical protein PPYR_08236 [Photinus pyralis]|uniref:palmitoyl-CoA hydrolase n=1 Tax=Photinus pyralis TaxID=7054 RepID=A0A5N4A6Y1_PHOPY|nr:lysosomal thioesterase PPT2 homolog [Photinus pyralis]XP_031354583.1 lysosomal thioesterase PPT2 homolog [Photinus pyralis]KAB0793029.1 hypothetical protein PPYR_12649 [Photinus pyralis]KAB0797242.1 hypothetical protein PPYR_08236 [Photinus pyralis]